MPGKPPMGTKGIGSTKPLTSPPIRRTVDDSAGFYVAIALIVCIVAVIAAFAGKACA